MDSPSSVMQGGIPAEISTKISTKNFSKMHRCVNPRNKVQAQQEMRQEEKKQVKSKPKSSKFQPFKVKFKTLKAKFKTFKIKFNTFKIFQRICEQKDQV